MPSESSWAAGHTGRPIARDGASAEAAPPSTKKPTELGFGQFSSHPVRLALTGRGYLGFADFRLFPACDGPPLLSESQPSRAEVSRVCTGPLDSPGSDLAVFSLYSAADAAHVAFLADAREAQHGELARAERGLH